MRQSALTDVLPRLGDLSSSISQAKLIQKQNGRQPNHFVLVSVGLRVLLLGTELKIDAKVLVRLREVEFSEMTMSSEI